MSSAANTNDKPPSIGLSAIIVGFVGFCAGFFGPILVNPDANQGPLVGIFLTGPGGVVGGLILGLLFRLLHLGAVTGWRALMLICSIFVVITLYFCLPQPQWRGEIIEARAVRCLSPQELLPAAISRWERSIAAAPWAKVPSDWQQRAQQVFRNDSGIVLEMAIVRRAEVYELRRPWNRGDIDIRAWQAVVASKNYYARDANCATYLQRSPTLYYPQADRNSDNAWPPLVVPDFLDLLVLGAVPANYQPQP